MNGVREQWGSRLGFILAAAGSAVGLGNIWRFPYVTGTNGGAAFLIIYLVAIVLIGYPMMVTEVGIGRRTQRNPVGAFKALAPDTPWWLVGALGVLTGFVILSYYSVVAGWSLSYIFKAIAGFTPEMAFDEVFVGHISQIGEPILWHLIFMALCVGIIAAGVVKGIQRWVKLLMPVLAVLLVVVALRALTLPGAAEGVAFYLQPDFSEVTGTTFLDAIGQSFFTLSLGMGAMITYGSYLKKEDTVPGNGAYVVGADTAIAIIAGFAIFPAVFALGLEPGAGAGLTFITLPAVFAEIPAGSFFAFLFFVLLSIAALTSAISLMEVVVAWITDEKGMPRKTATILVGAISFIVGIPTVLGYSVLSDVTFLGFDLLDTYDWIANAIMLPVGGLLTAIFAGYVWTAKKAQEDFNNPPSRIVLGNWYGVMIKLIVPIAIIIVLVFGIIDVV